MEEMGEKRGFPWTAIFFWLAAACLGAAHHGAAAFAQEEAELPMPRVERMGVMPFMVGRYGGTLTDTLNCPVCRLQVETEAMTPLADRTLTGLVHQAALKQHGDKVVPLRESSRAFEGIGQDRTRDTPGTLAQKFGKALGANLVIAGSVWRFRERVGTKYNAQAPAAVAFAVYLIEVPGGRVLWKAVFSESQRTLSENILELKSFLEKGAKWLTAEELARYGVQQVFKKYPL